MRAKSCPRRWNVEPSQVPAAPKAPPLPKRERRFQRALDTLQLNGGILGVTSAARLYGCEPGNIDWHLIPWGKIDCGRVYLRADVLAAKARREGKS
jgi:hypothetical protein